MSAGSAERTVPASADLVTGEAPAAAARLSLKKNVVYAVVAMGLFTAGKFGVVALMAKFANVEILGQFTYAMALSGPVVLFLAFQARTAYVADAAGEFSFGTYQVLRLIGMGIAAVVLLGIIGWRFTIERNFAFTVILIGVCAGRIVQTAGEVIWGVYQKRERMDLMMWSHALRGAAMVLPFAALLPVYYLLVVRGGLPAGRLAEGTAWACVLYAVGWWAVTWFFDRRYVRGYPDVDHSWQWEAVARLAKQAFPLGLIMLIINLCENVPRWIMEAQPLGKQALGYYGALTNITVATSLVMVQALQATGHRLARYSQTSIPAFLRLTGKLTVLAVVMGGGLLVGMLLFGKLFLRICYTQEYVQYYPQFLVLVIAECLTLFSNVFGTATTFMRRFWVQVPVQLIVFLVTLGCAMKLIPADPVRGGAYTVLWRAVTQSALYFVVLVGGVIVRHRALTAAAGGGGEGEL